MQKFIHESMIDTYKGEIVSPKQAFLLLALSLWVI